ncbi:hypothetical protein SAY87_014563 [Trapa incisa]|uniref:Uncharacterized protein n=2 Tax=Trapa TaxID=22665 RepID=A0AAN7RMN2_TRANT|nr:hypothetical protein SAY87_014563 [Trapa incisa]KAK4801993.1 hypothetical protein SAY86_000196 [Trapa natans]
MAMLRLAEMKGSCTLLLSVLTASTAALTTSGPASPADPSCAPQPCSKQVQSYQSNVKTDSSSLSEKFATRFDGLKFIETLVTAHR